MRNDQSIGIFDSGVGGTSIWKEIVTKLPLENTIYLADSINAPYGDRTKQEIIDLSSKNTERLINLGAKIIVVACNTATTNAIDYLRSTYNIPFIGIEPAIKPAALHSKSKIIGILATKGTLNSSLFHSTMGKYTQDVKVIEVIGEGLVPLIEKGLLENNNLKELLKTFIAPMLEAGIDFLVLGCSHYPYLIPLLQELLPENVQIIDSGLAVAKQTEAILMREDMLHTISSTTASRHLLYSNKDIKILEVFVSRFRESALTPEQFTIEYLDF